MPDMRLVDAMQYQIRQRDRIDQLGFFPPVEGVLFERFDLAAF